eukprot:TRINITY_DN94177_c0_g1_i1.p1 TRINITY_DN94177_c0_g1~~TRINITY_DN94177_c0_g1_i1.p1  ORF type:complete len:590 (+),score=113.25 TRINITY_DN94177_c0_g1_i1:105-1772(+)
MALRRTAAALSLWWRVSAEASLSESAMNNVRNHFEKPSRRPPRDIGSTLTSALAFESRKAASHSRTLSLLLGLRHLHTFLRRREHKAASEALGALTAHCWAATADPYGAVHDVWGDGSVSSGYGYQDAKDAVANGQMLALEYQPQELSVSWNELAAFNGVRKSIKQPPVQESETAPSVSWNALAKTNGLTTGDRRQSRQQDVSAPLALVDRRYSVQSSLQAEPYTSQRLSAVGSIAAGSETAGWEEQKPGWEHSHMLVPSGPAPTAPLRRASQQSSPVVSGTHSVPVPPARASLFEPVSSAEATAWDEEAVCVSRASTARASTARASTARASTVRASQAAPAMDAGQRSSVQESFQHQQGGFRQESARSSKLSARSMGSSQQYRLPQNHPTSFRPSTTAEGPVAVPIHGSTVSRTSLQVSPVPPLALEYAVASSHQDDNMKRFSVHHVFQNEESESDVTEADDGVAESEPIDWDTHYDESRPSKHLSTEEVLRRRTLAAKALGVSRNAGRKTVAQAFRGHAKVHHPDKGGQTEDFQVVNAAYTSLIQQRTLDDRE